MASTTVRIGDRAARLLRDLARREGESMQTVLDRALEAYRRELFLREANEAYGKLRQDPKAWAEEVAERAEWDAALGDGLDRE